MSKQHRNLSLPRRSCMAVPGSSPKMLKKAQQSNADQVFLDLEDAVAPNVKVDARNHIVEALREGDWGKKIKVVRVNDVTTEWAYSDVITIVREAGAKLDCIMVPKVQEVAHINWIDILLSQLEISIGLEPGHIGLEVQLEGAAGIENLNEIAGASSRIETLIFGPGDFTADMKIPRVNIDTSVGPDVDPYYYAQAKILTCARKYQLQAIDGPYAKIHDLEGYRRAAEKSYNMGYDGKWVLHPKQIDVANDTYQPSQEAYDRAELILEAYEYYTSEKGGNLGAVMLGDEMIDEAVRKLALVTAERGRVANMTRTTKFQADE